MEVNTLKERSYFELRSHLHPRERNQKAHFTLRELEDVWYCTRKNVKRKIKQFEEEGHYTYVPGQGRGNPSHLQFHKPFQQEIEEYVERYAARDQLDPIVQLFQLPIPKTWISNVSQHVQELFGLQSTHEELHTLRTGIARKLGTLDPLYTSVTFESHMIDQFSDTLVKYDEQQDKLIPHIAHHWNVDENHRVWTFHLRKGVKFHHHKTLTSEDVRYSYTRFIEYDSPLKWMVSDIQSIECPTPYKVMITLNKPNPFFIRYVSSVNMAILPSDIPFDETKWIGTGPFMLKEMDDHKIVIEAFDYYFLERALLDRIEFWRVPMGAAEAMNFQIGRNESSTSVEKYEDIEVGFRFLIFNFHGSHFAHDRHFREAIYHLLNMPKMWGDLDREDKSKGKVATSFHPWRSTRVEKNPNKVDTLLEKSDYNGEALKLYVLDFPQAIEEADWLANEAKPYGIKFDIHTFTLDSLYTDIIQQNADLSFMGEVASADIYLSFLGAFYNQALKFRKLLSEEHLSFIDEKLEEYKKKPNQAKQVEIMEEIEAYLRKNNLILFQFHPIKKRTFDPMIQDIHFQSFGYVDFRKLWIP